MFKIAFVQPNFKQGPGGIGAYLPYSCGLLWSYALTKEIIKNNFELHRIIYKREQIKELADELSKMDIVTFSTYVWNRNYNFKLASLIKDLNKNVLIIFGGPDCPINKTNLFLDIMPFADIIVKNEGEYIFSECLEHFVSDKLYSQVKGLLINDNGNRIDTGASDRINNLDEIPSPYLTGVFDNLLSLEQEWNGTLETNRGCPYKCTFCDWGSLTYSKIKKFGIQRVFDELEWMGKNKIGFLDVADANFGIFVERDNQIVDKLIEVQSKYGYPYRTGWSWAKNQQSEVVSIAKKLIQSGHFNNGLTISLQSLDKNTLETIKRSNMDISKINEIFAECRKENVPLNVELILGLPSETYSSWENTMYGVFEVGQHDSIEVWQAQILENAEMNLSQRDEYKLKGQKVLDYFPNSINDVAPEYSEIVTETSTMSLNEMIEAYKLSWFLITWHTGGISQYAARFIRKYFGESYKSFYTKFREWLQSNPYWKEQEYTMSKTIRNWYERGETISNKLGDIYVTASTNQYRTLFEMHYTKRYEDFYKLVDEFLKQYELDETLHNDIMKMNRSVIGKHNNLINYKIQTQYNILEYITDTETQLEKITKEYEVKWTHDPIRSKELNWFMESIFYARRRSFGKNQIK